MSERLVPHTFAMEGLGPGWEEYAFRRVGFPFRVSNLREKVMEATHVPVARIDMEVARDDASDANHVYLIIHHIPPGGKVRVDITACTSADEVIAVCLVSLRLSGGAP